jgi:hypothetical protein
LTTRVRGRNIHRMKPSAVVAGVLACVLAGTTVLSAQLGEVARKETERRKTAKTGKTYTNDNLPSAPQPSPSSTGTVSSDAAVAPPAPPSSSNAAPPPPPRVSSDPAERKKDEAQWRERVKSAKDALERAKTFADALQTKINALNADFVNRDDPAQRAVIAADRDKALAQMDQLKKEIAEHTKAVTGIQEEARKAGVPAGWVR